MSLRIAWLGPWCEQSAIAMFGQEVVSELETRGHQVTIFRTELGDWLRQTPLPSRVPARSLTEHCLQELRWSFDYIFANVGDHCGYHGALPPLLPRLSATAIFHDGFIANLASSYAASALGSEESGRKIIEFTYGRDVELCDSSIWDPPLEIIAAERPMTEWLARLASGCVTHSPIWADRLRRACAGPVAVVPLCYPDPRVEAPAPIGESLTISTVGHINPNKCANQVLYALASDPRLAEGCQYQLLGEISADETKRLSDIAETLNIPAPTFRGRLSDDDLRAALAKTDVVACLRNPVLEGGSASLVTGLLSARPTLVSRHAHYAEVPAGLVLSCTPGEEAQDVAKHLRWVMDNRDEARAMGQRARQYALSAHGKQSYVDKLLDLASRSVEYSPSIRAATQLGQILGSIDAEPDDPSIASIAKAIEPAAPPTSDANSAYVSVTR